MGGREFESFDLRFAIVVRRLAGSGAARAEVREGEGGVGEHPGGWRR